MRKLYGLKFFVILAIVLIPVFSGCNAGITNMNSSKTEEIAELLKAVPVHPDKIEINTENYASGSNTSITRKYKSDAPFNRVREFYLEQLKAQGWQLSEERELKDKGRYRGGFVQLAYMIILLRNYF